MSEREGGGEGEEEVTVGGVRERERWIVSDSLKSGDREREKKKLQGIRRKTTRAAKYRQK